MVRDILLLNNPTTGLDFAWQNTRCCRWSHVPTLLLSKQIKCRLKVMWKGIWECQSVTDEMQCWWRGLAPICSLWGGRSCFLHWAGEFEGLAGSDGYRIQRGGGSHQVLLLFSKNDHITPKWQNWICRKGFHLASSLENATPECAWYTFSPCLASVLPQRLLFSLSLFPLSFIVQILLLDEYYHCMNSIFLRSLC